MLEHSINRVYLKFKLNFYKKIFSRFETREACLTAVETFCVEVIYALGTPTVNEFAQYVSISQPNATHKIRSLIEKGYVVKTQSDNDRREYTLAVTDKFFRYYNVSNAYIKTVADRIKSRLNPGDLEILQRYFDIIGQELMPEIELRETLTQDTM